MAIYKTSADIAAEMRSLIQYDMTQLMLAKKMGVSAAYLCDVLQGRRNVGPKILRALGYEALPRYRKVRP